MAVYWILWRCAAQLGSEPPHQAYLRLPQYEIGSTGKMTSTIAVKLDLFQLSRYVNLEMAIYRNDKSLSKKVPTVRPIFMPLGVSK